VVGRVLADSARWARELGHAAGGIRRQTFRGYTTLSFTGCVRARPAQQEVRAKDELAIETAGLETTVCLGDLIEGDALSDARPDGASCQQAEEPLQVLTKPGGMSRPHHVDRVAAGTPAARQPPPKIQAHHPNQQGEYATRRLHARRVAVGAEQAAALERRQRASKAILADTIEHDVEAVRSDSREVFALVVDRLGAELANQ